MELDQTLHKAKTHETPLNCKRLPTRQGHKIHIVGQLNHSLRAGLSNAPYQTLTGISSEYNLSNVIKIIEDRVYHNHYLYSCI